HYLLVNDLAWRIGGIVFNGVVNIDGGNLKDLAGVAACLVDLLLGALVRYPRRINVYFDLRVASGSINTGRGYIGNQPCCSRRVPGVSTGLNASDIASIVASLIDFGRSCSLRHDLLGQLYSVRGGDIWESRII